MPRIGLISDTHGFLDPKVTGHFTGVDHILHGGDIGWPKILLELEQIAPVTAVSGNTDAHPGWRETEIAEVGGRTFLIHHIVDPRRLADGVRRRIAKAKPDVVVFGHTHETFCEVIDGVLFVNPGSAGKARFGRPRTVAVLRWDGAGSELAVDFIELGP